MVETVLVLFFFAVLKYKIWMYVLTTCTWAPKKNFLFSPAKHFKIIIDLYTKLNEKSSNN